MKLKTQNLVERWGLLDNSMLAKFWFPLELQHHMDSHRGLR